MSASKPCFVYVCRNRVGAAEGGKLLAWAPLCDLPKAAANTGHHFPPSLLLSFPSFVPGLDLLVLRDCNSSKLADRCYPPRIFRNVQRPLLLYSLHLHFLNVPYSALDLLAMGLSWGKSSRLLPTSLG